MTRATAQAVEGRRPLGPYVLASALGAVGGAIGFVHTNPWLATFLFLPDRAPANGLEEAAGWAIAAGGLVTYAALPWVLRWRGWETPVAMEAAWPRAVKPVLGVALVACVALLLRAHDALDQEDPATVRARYALVALLAVGLAGTVLAAVALRHVRPWGALVASGVVAACAIGPIALHATSYAGGGEAFLGFLFLGAPSLALLGVELAVLARIGGAERARRLWLGLATGILLALVCIAAFLLADLDGQAADAQRAHEEAPGLPMALAAIVLVAVAWARRRRAS